MNLKIRDMWLWNGLNSDDTAGANTPMGDWVASGRLVCPNAQDFASVEAAATWNGTHAMTVPTTKYPVAVQKIMFLKAGTAFVNNIYVDFTGGATSTDIQFSFRDNSTTSGDFLNAAQGSIPVFALSGSTFSGTGKILGVTLLSKLLPSVLIKLWSSQIIKLIHH